MLVGVAERIWTLPHRLTIGGMNFGTHTHVLGLPGGIALSSPGPLEASDVEAIRALGEVRWIFAPNAHHTLFFREALERFPAAEVRISTRLSGRFPELEGDVELSTHWQVDGLRSRRIDGAPWLSEWVFFHEISRTLVLTDLCFNFVAHPNPVFRCLMRMNDAYGKFGPSRLARLQMRDRAAVMASVDEICAWPFERALVCHGDPVVRVGPSEFRRLFQRHLTRE